MNHCAIQRNSFSSCEETRSSVTVSVTISDKRDNLVCPKPRRVGLFQAVNDPIRPMKWLMSTHQSEICDSKEGADLLDILLAKGGYGSDKSCTPAASSPPFFSGSPPSRVSNPLIQDARFGDQTFTPVSPQSIPIPSGVSTTTSPSSSSRKGGCVRGNFGNKPAVRIEGFDCLDRDNRRNCSIPTLA